MSGDNEALPSNEKGELDKLPAAQAGDAVEAAVTQTHMSLLEGLRRYPKAAGWSILLSTTIVMLAYDTILLGSFYAYPSFQRKYGEPAKKGYQIPASWQSGLSDGSNVGGIIGLILNGFLSDRYGHRSVMLGALVATTGFIFILFFAPNLTVLLVGEILCGIPFGMFQGLTTAYASEVVPVVLRHYLTSYINLCWVFGHFIGAGVLRGLLSRTDKWGYKIPFAIQWIWPAPLFIGIIFAPESPWFLIRRARFEDAKRSLRRLATRPDDAELDDNLKLMIHTNDIEREVQSGTSYFDCFKGVDLRRTEIVCMAYLIQYLSGNGLSGYSTYFFEQAGLSTTDSFDLTMAQYAIGFVGTVLSWFLMARFGRRTLYLTGMVLSSILLMIIGFLGLASDHNDSANWAKGALLLVFFCVHSLFIGPLLYAIIGEIPSTRLRQKSIVLAASAWSILGLVNASLTPHMLNPTSWNWGAKAGFFWGGLSILSTVWTYFRLPEAKNRTFAELDVLFNNRVSARKFRTCAVDLSNGTVAEGARDASVVG
ncbi:hypothetical protein M409DRAFT_65549 [Zasmidium cellare ATCC 36951]|uniref:Major facilitator superfamily (MFS) profile domain-containing protein n=1 Tax=Zasmidium cellare ATCC 36951 TaxID=1080233 RepID=A0A6A6CNI2_ZASCE|nr:uncharacterized protein M409DRAFT_65549 [Zasmidium cellare ATCC 36951]KAF2168684.1 hypothetical protein M409DRAFT_65549 [Zasmidium cellare ATCC 36951]